MSASVDACSLYTNTQTIKLRGLTAYPLQSSKVIIPPSAPNTWLKKDTHGLPAFEIIDQRDGTYLLSLGRNMLDDYMFKVIINSKDSVYIPLPGRKYVCQLKWNIPASMIDKIEFEVYKLVH